MFMCGILACFSPQGKPVNEETFHCLLDNLQHRGPNDSGVWSSPEAGVVMGHRRLSILDLSPLGHQPMDSRNQRWTLIYNGEIYNWKDMRDRLVSMGVSFRSAGDTEVLLEGISNWGLEATLRQCVGVFAIAVWDREERKMYIARDRMGEKPLYYGWKNGTWWIASELKAIAAAPSGGWELDPEAIGLYMRYKYVPEPYSIYREIRKLPPGSLAELRSDGTADKRPYWNFSEVVERGQAEPFQGSIMEAADELESLLRESIRLQRVADVPVGAFLSGGIDSSTVVALMQAQGGDPVRTFCIGFDEADYDESGYARAVAKHLGTVHTELKVTPDEAMAVIPQLASIYDEPFADSSAIPTILVCRLARKQVTVALSGDAGDELFGGYNRYPQLSDLWGRMQARPAWLSNGLSALYGAGRRVCSLVGCENLAQKFLWHENYAKIQTMPELYANLLTHCNSLDFALSEPPNRPLKPKTFPVNTPYHYGMACDATEYLPGDGLVKVDRAAMSCALETRIPLLDHRIVEWAWSLPESHKADRQKSKKVLRTVLHRYVPESMMDRPKKGFGIPVGEWIRGPLLDWAESLISETAIRKAGILHPRRARAIWTAHRDRKVDDPYRVWALLMLQAWLLK